MSLNATVQRLRNQDHDQKGAEQDGSAFISAWRNDVGLVYERFEEALEPFVKDGAARFYRGQTTLSEEMLGEYTIETLTIEVIGRRILLTPIARMTVRGTGRLDLYREDRPAENNRILLVRGSVDVGHAPEVWVIQDRRDEPKNMLQAAFLPLEALKRSTRRAYRLLNGEAIQDSVDFLLNID